MNRVCAVIHYTNEIDVNRQGIGQWVQIQHNNDRWFLYFVQCIRIAQDLNVQLDFYWTRVSDIGNAEILAPVPCYFEGSWAKRSEPAQRHAGKVSKASVKAAPDVGESDVLIEETNISRKYWDIWQFTSIFCVLFSPVAECENDL